MIGHSVAGRLSTATVAAVLATAAAMIALDAVVAASDVRIPQIGCSPTYHPPVIAIQNFGDTAQDLRGWRLESDQPDEVFDLSVAGSLGPGAAIFVFNGHGYYPAPGDEQLGYYAWNNGSFDYAIVENGTDFVRLVDAGGAEVSSVACPIPPQTPAPQPTQPPVVDTNTGGDPSTPATNQGDSAPAGGSVQDVPSANTAVGSDSQTASQGTGTSRTSTGRITDTDQTTAIGGEEFGPPLPPGSEAPLPAGGGPPLASESLSLETLSVMAGIAAMLAGLTTAGLAFRRPQGDA